MNTNKFTLLTLLLVSALGLAGCDKSTNTAENPDGKVNQAADTASDKMDKASAEASKAGTAMEDTTITAKVKADFLAESGLKSSDISVDTVKGVVTLTGTTDTQENSDKAKKIASDVSGVKSVVNQLKLKP